MRGMTRADGGGWVGRTVVRERRVVVVVVGGGVVGRRGDVV